ncbi:MAG: hypothetical protein IT324_21710 [Anaerolineae bacterium]|nr:hypothetical protein [Anaerolineae bacterium]
MAGCLTFILRIIAETLVVRVVQEVLQRVTVDHLWGLLAAVLALFGIRLRKPNQP